MQNKKTYYTNGLDNLISRNTNAKDYFMALGEDAQGMLRQRSNMIRDIDDLHRAAMEVDFQG